MVTLDDMVAAHGGAAPEIVEIDAEGLDPDVIRGASRMVAAAAAVFCEVGVFSRAPNGLAAVVNEMDGRGDRPLHVTDLNASTASGVLHLAELVFARRDGAVAERIPAAY